MLNKFRKLFQNRYPIISRNGVEFIFVHINKTAGTSILDSINVYKKQHYTTKEIIDIIGVEKWESTYKFAFVRNPWDKVVSHYYYRIKTNQNNLKSFNIDCNDWVKYTFGENKDEYYYNNPKMFLSQSDWLKDYNSKIIFNRIGKFENLSNDFELIKKDLGITKSLAHMNKSLRSEYRLLYNESSIDIIANCFEEDILNFDYSF